ncbi:peptidase domain-containing ABC transporter [Herbaspirillum sp. WKF16]|uniref:peptidase domain-containing ABC transporter n=1 Tax=Herbaspirillum sp. WKF16 TaxID=3028312 RepID=UPI0023A9C7D3|nr:peptidase domain-containing ABC transporter [Herbaspirillum sp. WKF16]WDZ94930.1 peptidase domain-containing ABC transporter [Herbaspirillum sp. WKF16]
MRRIEIGQTDFLWILQSVCLLFRKPFSLPLAQQHFPSPHDLASLQEALWHYGLHTSVAACPARKPLRQPLPFLAFLKRESAAAGREQPSPALVLQMDAEQVSLLRPGDLSPCTMALAAFAGRLSGQIVHIQQPTAAANDADVDEAISSRPRFGFRWFIPELLKHRGIWEEVLLASFAIQLMALATPLFTQAIIDKVVVHRTQSTLFVIVICMILFMAFSALLSWLRQYLILHTGNRVDAVLGCAVFERLLKLPPLYFQNRPTGVVAARLHGVETIRDFIASAAVSLVLDLPFLLIFVGVMLYYSVPLTLIVLAVLALIVGLSLMTAPLFQTRLQEQFRLGARNQAFLTEYIAGMETVKSLQLEPQLHARYRGFLADYLQAGFASRQLGNSYNTLANLLEQCMSLLILGVGAYAVMQSAEFTIGMLVAFQMFAGKLSQPMLRLVGLWQQFQQARLSVARLGDIMNAPTEPYSVMPARDHRAKGAIQIEQISFRYHLQQGLLYENLSLSVQPGQAVAIMGPSGCGKSTLAKLLQGFYQPEAGAIRIDGIDIRYLAANQLRRHFGVVPQETILFSGTLYDNLLMASPQATFEQVSMACKMAEIHQAIEALPQGYQTEIGERGAGLSGGQKQRIAIARALLKRPDILIFDEATSALDSVTAELFARTVNNLKGKVTMLFITHGLPRGLKLDAIYRIGPGGAQAVAMPSAAPASMATAGQGNAQGE